ncbi:MAG: EthD domain-containing protein [Proteobacteria bacterium]|nr:EthD domain-containing protein [Pseudomonadota bacterium]HQR03187.1 EthD domain-containing protein [Rhodocyclaceae bacterium]
MEKLVYLLGHKPAATPVEFSQAMLAAVPALRAAGAKRIDLLLADLNEPVRQACPARIAGPWDDLAGVAQFWLDNVDHRSAVEPVLAAVAGRLDSYLVTESVVQPYVRDWPEGARRPGVNQFTAHAKPEDVSEEDFYHHWQVEHSAISFELHPLRWSYIRHAVARPLTAGAPPYRAIVSEHFRELRDFTDENRYFGSPGVVQRMYADLHHFCDHTRMVTGPMSEYNFD